MDKECKHKWKEVKKFTNEEKGIYTKILMGYCDIWVLKCSKCGDMKNHRVWRSK